MKKIRKTLLFFSAIIMMLAFSVVVSATDDTLYDDYEAVEYDYENDPLYLKYLNQPMTMAVFGASSLSHNRTFANYDKVYGVDVSYFQNTINWRKVKAAGIDYAIIRVGYRGYVNGALAVDPKFEENIENAKAAGIKVGVYFFTQAINTSEAREEANHVLEQIKGYTLDMPVYIDMEEISYDSARFDRAHLSYTAKTNICKTFCDTIKKAGYRAGVYASKNCLTYHFNGPELAKNYDIWVAHYNNYTDYYGEYHMWQYTGTGRVNGISTTVDMNVLYMKNGPMKVTNLRANGYGTKVNLSWDSSFGAHGYTIYAKNLETGAISEVAKTTLTSKSVTLPYAKSRFYVKAYYNIGTKYAYSPYSAGVSAFKNYLPEVTNVTVDDVNSNSVSLSWDKLTYCDGYIIYKYDDVKKKYQRLIKTTDKTAYYKVTGLSPNKAYKFAVKAYKTVDQKEVASGSFLAVTATTRPTAVTGFKVSSIAEKSVVLAWDKYPNVEGYIIYRYDKVKSKWVRIDKTVKNINSYTVSKLNGGTTYKFAVRAYVTVDGKESASSGYPTVSAYTRPVAVTGISSVSSSKSIKLTWNKASGINGYILYQYIGGKWTRIALPSTNTYTINNLSQAKTYWFTVKAYKFVNNKEVSSEKYNVYKTSTNPDTVSFSVIPGSRKATLKWNKINGATGYIAYYKTSAKDTWKRIAVTSGTTALKTGLTKGKTYYFTVKAYRNYNGLTYNGKFITKTARIK